MASTSKAPRPRLAISLRVLMLAVLVVGGWAGWVANRVRTQRRAVATIRAAKGSVTYDFQNFPRNTPRAVVQAAKPLGPAWLRRLVGDEPFQEVASVTLAGPVSAETMRVVGSFGGLHRLSITGGSTIEGGLAALGGSIRMKLVNIKSPSITDADLAILARQPDLDFLWLTGADITDAGLARLSGLRHLTIFNLAGCPKVTDRGVEALTPVLPALVNLELVGTSVTDASMPAIGRLPVLTGLDLSRTRITDGGVAHLAGLAKLQYLTLGDIALTDRGLASLRGMTKLELLYLPGTAITDAGLAHLAGLTEISQLDLRRTPITGQGLAHLGGLGKLWSLNLRESDFSDEGATTLAKLARLESVDLIATRISDAGLAGLQGMPKLLTLFVGGSLVTEAGFASFRQAAPQVKRASNRYLQSMLPPHS